MTHFPVPAHVESMSELFDKAMEHSRDDPNEAGLVVIAWLEKTPVLDARYGQELKILGAITYAGLRPRDIRQQIRAKAARQPGIATALVVSSSMNTDTNNCDTGTMPIRDVTWQDVPEGAEALASATLRPPVPKDLGMMARNLSAACNADIWFAFPLQRGLKLGDAYKDDVAIARRTRLRGGGTLVQDGAGLWLLESAIKRTRAAVRQQFTDAEVGAFMMQGRDPALMVKALQAQEAEDAQPAAD